MAVPVYSAWENSRYFDGWCFYKQNLAYFSPYGSLSTLQKDTLQTSRFLIPKCPQVHYWQIYRSNLVKELKTLKDVAWTGDGRFDSIGHSAKYGAYTMLCTTIMKIVHFEVVQVHHHVRAKFG